ncbi:MAG: hypothetical protein GVY30_08390 [Chloroflexi bacterium]|nr:hypothetical protein [Chloroflexota bacterium]
MDSALGGRRGGKARGAPKPLPHLCRCNFTTAVLAKASQNRLHTGGVLLGAEDDVAPAAMRLERG